ncbi:hypothetical protein BDN71DRAFT_94755 [Pleurotus eryngii]|uniref:Uncharacterized protein n=1 Tax=Pleurotus eryngii TaxID=5323 RepID=A0A9P5ZN94_PLEER|nr:hypothetical protein BDN71DRAFT_94755 [Pleurotus eryngii]
MIRQNDSAPAHSAGSHRSVSYLYPREYLHSEPRFMHVPHTIDLTSSPTSMTPEARSQPIVTSTATSRAAAVSGHVRRICEHSDRTQNSRNARVCRLWTSEALSAVWRKLHSFLPLLRLLTPMSCRISEDGAAEDMRPGNEVQRRWLGPCRDAKAATQGHGSDPGSRPRCVLRWHAAISQIQ